VNADDIRADVVEVLAESLFTIWAAGRGIEGYIWADCEEAMRRDFLDHAEIHADALAAAGYLVVAQEGRYIGRGMARRTRYVTGWIEPETGSALTTGSMRVTRVKLTAEQVAERRKYAESIGERSGNGPIPCGAENGNKPNVEEPS
jgi:hypothetical protein